MTFRRPIRKDLSLTWYFSSLVRAFSSATSRIFQKRANRRPDDFPPTSQEGSFTYLIFFLSSESLFLSHFQALHILSDHLELVLQVDNLMLKMGSNTLLKKSCFLNMCPRQAVLRIQIDSGWV